jgi:hypothetical protein
MAYYFTDQSCLLLIELIYTYEVWKFMRKLTNL